MSMSDKQKREDVEKRTKFNYMPIIILLIFGIGIAFIIGTQIGWHKGFETAKSLLA